jgi:hypothetical protein
VELVEVRVVGVGAGDLDVERAVERLREITGDGQDTR